MADPKPIEEKKPRGPRPAREETPELAGHVEDFNARYFCVGDWGGQFRICREAVTENRRTGGTEVELVAARVKDFVDSHLQEKVRVGERGGRPIVWDKGNAWLHHPRRRQYERVVFEPPSQHWPDLGAAPGGHYNLWRGFAYRPARGDCSLYLAHVRDNVCRGDSVKYSYLIRWMANAVRNPGESGQVAIAVKGRKGVGKNVFAEGFADLFGPHGMVVSDQDRITRNFNGHLMNKVVLVADEAFWAGDRRHEGTLKHLITGDRLVIERKGVDVVQARNCLHLVLLSNERWIVPATADERRFLVLGCSDARREDHEYFGAVAAQLKSGGYEALLWHLLEEVDLSGFDVRSAPSTPELLAQMTEGLRGAERVWFDYCLTSGLIPGRVERDGTAWARPSDLEEFFAERAPRGERISLKHVTLMLREMGLKPGKKDQARGWSIPALAEARERWDERQFRHDWPEDGGQWEESCTP